MFEIEFTTIWRVSDYDVKAAIVHDFGKAISFPVKNVDTETIFFSEKPQLRKRRVNNGVTALDVAAEVRQGTFVKKPQIRPKGLVVSPSRTLSRSDSFVTSTAWESMSTP